MGPNLDTNSENRLFRRLRHIEMALANRLAGLRGGNSVPGECRFCPRSNVSEWLNPTGGDRHAQD